MGVKEQTKHVIGGALAAKGLSYLRGEEYLRTDENVKNGVWAGVAGTAIVPPAKKAIDEVVESYNSGKRSLATDVRDYGAAIVAGGLVLYGIKSGFVGDMLDKARGLYGKHVKGEPEKKSR
ncbi:hypothetical protein JW711_00030 [Candidatus Woesearchaeota archaeon]|nr:hypothetical protein [Candidatus Woesearchaeota archaeon]